MSKEVMEVNCNMASDIANNRNEGLFERSGLPDVGSIPPGTVKVAVNMIVAISAATMVHALAVSFNPLLSSFF